MPSDLLCCEVVSGNLRGRLGRQISFVCEYWARWTAESGSSSSEPSSNSEHWIVVTDLEQQTLTDHDSSSDWDEDVYLMPRDNVQPSTTVNEYGEHMTWPVHYPEEERVVPSTQS
ncbi:unnamed protein product [Microthlaspi erraticum]|uniref:Uncharacterized protein n=1 Tax=Microthlaspi erraticum TaxID=1685480 RepID=A0A6D2KHS7_9BRAS|nr:unnamed protein product [Microthlaspi erraticum]